MFQVKAPPPLHLAPPLASRPRVEIGCACSPGALVRMPVEGIYYETLPADLGHDADLLQAALLDHQPRRLSLMPLLLYHCLWPVSRLTLRPSLRSAVRRVGTTGVVEVGG